MSHTFTTVVEPAEAPLWATNAAQERLESKAEDEFASNHPMFRKWLMDCDMDILDFGGLISACARVYSDGGRQDVDEAIGPFLLRYKQWRANDQTELDCLLADVIADARDECASTGE